MSSSSALARLRPLLPAAGFAFAVVSQLESVLEPPAALLHTHTLAWCPSSTFLMTNGPYLVGQDLV